MKKKVEKFDKIAGTRCVCVFCCKSMCVCENVGEKMRRRERARLCVVLCLKEVVGNGFLRRNTAHVLRRRLEYGEATC